jgi:hypothetical protein
MRLAALLLLSLALGLAADDARAASYDVWACRLPDGRAAPLDGWSYDGLGSGANQCPDFGFSASLPGSGAAASATAGWWFETPPGLTISGYELFRSARTGSGADGSQRVYGLYRDVPDFDPLGHLLEYCTPTAGCYAVGHPYPADPMDPANRVVKTGLNSQRIILRVECRGANGSHTACGPSSVGGSVAVARARMSLVDAYPPTLTVAGPLAVPGVSLTGVQSATVAARDAGGGIERLELRVDGKTVERESVFDQASSCRAPFTRVVPCPASVRRTLAYDTAALPNGVHSIQIAAVDAAGNSAVSAASTVRVVNGSVANGFGASRRSSLNAHFVSADTATLRDHVSVRFGRTRPIAGRLTDADGIGIGSATLTVMSRARRRGAETRRAGTVITDEAGRFRYLPVPGSSRELRVEYRAFSLDEAPSATATAKLNVRAGVRLRVVPRRTTSRGTIRFSGRLVGGPGRRRIQVTLYAVTRVGRSRVPVAVLRTDGRGRFRFAYRFVRTFAPFTYRFQARVEAQPTYPYAAAGSNIATVRVVR